MLSVGMPWSELLALVALAFLAIHLLTDARRMGQVLRLQHSRKGHKKSTDLTCPRCEMVGAGVKEAWWEIATLVALVGHITFDYVG